MLGERIRAYLARYGEEIDCDGAAHPAVFQPNLTEDGSSVASWTAFLPFDAIVTVGSVLTSAIHLFTVADVVELRFRSDTVCLKAIVA